MEWKDVAQILFLAGWSCIGVWVARSIDEIKRSVQELNIKMAVYVAHSDNHERRILKLEEKL